jgi:Coenzyme PQQ synthesis protein D (PqqD)
VTLALRQTDADLTTVEIDGEVSAYNPLTDRVVMLNATASDVFTLCDGTMDEDAIADLLARAYRADVAEVRAGVVEAVTMLVSERLVERVDITL